MQGQRGGQLELSNQPVLRESPNLLSTLSDRHLLTARSTLAQPPATFDVDITGAVDHGAEADELRAWRLLQGLLHLALVFLGPVGECECDMRVTLEPVTVTHCHVPQQSRHG